VRSITSPRDVPAGAALWPSSSRRRPARTSRSPAYRGPCVSAARRSRGRGKLDEAHPDVRCARFSACASSLRAVGSGPRSRAVARQVQRAAPGPLLVALRRNVGVDRRGDDRGIALLPHVEDVDAEEASWSNPNASGSASSALTSSRRAPARRDPSRRLEEPPCPPRQHDAVAVLAVVDTRRDVGLGYDAAARDRLARERPSLVEDLVERPGAPPGPVATQTTSATHTAVVEVPPRSRWRRWALWAWWVGVSPRCLSAGGETLVGFSVGRGGLWRGRGVLPARRGPTRPARRRGR